MVKFEYKQKKIIDRNTVWGVELLGNNAARGLYYGLLVIAQCYKKLVTQEQLAYQLGLTPPTFFKYRNILQGFNLISIRQEKPDIVYELYIPET